MEAAAEIHDLIVDDLLSLFPEFKVRTGWRAAAEQVAVALLGDHPAESQGQLQRAKHSPSLFIWQDDVHVKLIETKDHILGAFDRHISEYADKHFAREGIEVRLSILRPPDIHAVHYDTINSGESQLLKPILCASAQVVYNSRVCQQCMDVCCAIASDHPCM